MGLKIQNVWNHHLDLILMSSDILSTSLYLHCSPCKATTSQQDKHWSWSFTQMGKIVFYNRTLHAISMWFSSCDFFADINVRISQQTLHYTHLWKEAVAWPSASDIGPQTPPAQAQYPTVLHHFALDRLTRVLGVGGDVNCAILAFYQLPFSHTYIHIIHPSLSTVDSTLYRICIYTYMYI